MNSLVFFAIRWARFAALGFVLVGCQSVIFPPAVVPARPNATDWPDTGAVVLDSVASLHYTVIRNDDGGSERTAAVLEHRQRIKILSEEGLDEAIFELPMDGYSTITTVKGRSVDSHGRVQSLGRDGAKIVGRKGHRQEAEEIKYTIFKIPGASVGGVLDVYYRRVYTHPELVPPWVFASHLPTIRSEFSVRADDGIKVDYRYGDGQNLKDAQPLRREDHRGVRFVFVETDLPAVYPEPMMPHPARVAPWVATAIVSAHLGGDKVRLETWEDIAARVRNAFAAVGPYEMEGTARQRFAKVREALHGLDLDGLGVRGPISAKALMNGEPASTRDAAALLLAALEGSGVKAFPALVTAAHGPPAIEGFPALYPFVRAVVALDVREEVSRDESCREDPVSRGLLCSVPEDSYAFLDPLCATCRYGELPTPLTGGRALVFVGDRTKWIDIPQDPPERNRLMTQFVYELGVDGKLKGALSGEVAGVTARRLREAFMAHDSGTKRTELIEEILFGDKPALTVDTLLVGGKRQIEKNLRLKANITGEAEKVDFQDYRLPPRMLVGDAWPGDWRSSRRTMAALPAPVWIESVASVTLPVGFVVEPREVVKWLTPHTMYAAGYAQHGRTLDFSRRLIIKNRFVSANEWREFWRALQAIEQAESLGIRVRMPEEE